MVGLWGVNPALRHSCRCFPGERKLCFLLISANGLSGSWVLGAGALLTKAANEAVSRGPWRLHSLLKVVT